MPPKIRYDRETMIAAAFELARRDGLEAVNARSLAKAIGCSTQPLFREFQSMEQIRAEVLRRAYALYGASIEHSAGLAVTPYKATGVAYIRFAAEEPELFKMLFMRDRQRDGTVNDDDESLDYVLDALIRRTGFTREEAREFHIRQWVFVHGLAVMAATRYVPLDPERLDALLTGQFEATLLYFQSQKDK